MGKKSRKLNFPGAQGSWGWGGEGRGGRCFGFSGTSNGLIYKGTRKRKGPGQASGGLVMGRTVLVLHLPQARGSDMASKEGELVGCFKINLTHFLGDLKFPTTATLVKARLGGTVPFPVTSPPGPYPTPSLKEHARSFLPSGSARVSFLQHFSQVRRAQRIPPFSFAPLRRCFLEKSAFDILPGEAPLCWSTSNRSYALYPLSPPPLSLSILTSWVN